MTAIVAVASVPSVDTPGLCVHFHGGKRSYVFGRASEGLQRAYNSRRLSWSGTEHLFLSGPVDWGQLGGVFGYLLTLGGLIELSKVTRIDDNIKRVAKGKQPLPVDMFSGTIEVHGGDNLSHVLASSRSAIYRQPCRLRVHETRDDPRAADPSNLKPDWEDDLIRVWKVPVLRARSSSPMKRAHSSPPPGDDAGDEAIFKPSDTLSDPEVAALIVERSMFAGTVSNNAVLVPRELRTLKPTDQAVIMKNGTMAMYRGPYASEGAKLDNPDDMAFLIPEAGTQLAEVGDEMDGQDGRDGLELRSNQLPRTTYSDTSMCYIVKCFERRGKFDVATAKQLGVQQSQYKTIIGGTSVEVAGGKTITADMVMGEPLPGKGIIVADIPSRDFLDAFLARPEWANAELMNNIITMYWSLMPGMAEDARIQKFVQEHPDTKHVFCSEDTCPNMISNPGTAELQMKLRQIDPERFSLLHFDNTVKYPAPPSNSPIELGRAGTKVTLMPRVIFDDQAAAPFPDLVSAAKANDAETLALARKAKAASMDPEFLARIEEEDKDMPNRDTEVLALGTGSSVPSKYRNVSATLIRVPGVGNYLLDCGEGTLGQIRRAFDAEEAADVLRNLRCIAISHLHADHHMGTPSVVKAWYEQALKDGRSDATLAISCIARYRMFLQELSQVEDIGFHRLRFPSCPWPGTHNLNLSTTEHLDADDNFGLASIKRIKVSHCYRSHAVQLELKSGLRIAYSGDCRPSAAFARECHGAHLLVHESTFGDDMEEHAKSKKHSTVSEALGVARDMAAKRTLLTHFSQRYVKADTLRNDHNGGGGGGEGVQAGPVLFAFDFMRVRLGDFRKAALYIPAIERVMEGVAEH